MFRSIFNICLERFHRCVAKEKHLSKVTNDILGGSRRIIWGRKDEEYIADFYLIARRTLTAEEWRIFNARFLMGADWALCCRQLKIEKGIFFHNIYRIMQKLGREFREVSPYPLFPLDEYFGGTIRGARRQVYETGNAPVNPISGLKVVPLRAPIRKSKPEQESDTLLPRAA